MKSFGIASTAVAAVGFLAARAAASVDPIVISGSKFFYKTNGTQFFIKGVAYQQDVTGTTSSGSTYTDPLADPAGCKRDIPYLQELQTNTIRVYAIDPTQDHSVCMNLLADAGIYVVADLSNPDESINRDSPAWTDELYARYASVVDIMANYTNTLGFFAGNEVANAANNTNSIAFVKAAVRDTKAYIKSQGYRSIGVGYATADVSDIRVELADYMNCGSAADSVDFWGYNIYSWCGDSSYSTSGYEARTEEFSTYSVPVFFAEYGCNTVQPRSFTEVAALYGDEMSPVWSGGIVYMYFQESNDYGLVTVSGNSVSTLTDFDNYSKAIATVSPSSVNSASYSPTNTAQACPTEDSTWEAASSPLPPSPNQELCSCMYNSLSCVVSSSANSSDFGTLFGEVCGYGDYCGGIEANGTTGSYGAYGMCNSTEQLAFVFNAYYVAQKSSASACDFGGSATVKSATKATGVCSSLLAQAGTAGTGTVTSSPTATGAGAAGSGGSGSSSATSSGAASPGVSFPVLNAGYLSFGVYLFGALLSGAAMIIL